MKSTVKFKSNPNALKNAINKTVNKSVFDISCPNCKNKFKVQGSQFGTQVVCPSCHSMIMIDNTGFNKDINRIQKDFDKIFK